MADDNHPQLNIEQIRDLLSPYMDDEVTAEERALVEQGLDLSPELSRELEMLRQTTSLLSALPQMPAPRPFTLSEADVKPMGVAPRRSFGWPVWVMGWASLAATLLCVLAVGGFFLTQPGNRNLAMAPTEIARQSAATVSEDSAEAPVAGNAQDSVVEEEKRVEVEIIEEVEAETIVESQVERNLDETDEGASVETESDTFMMDNAAPPLPTDTPISIPTLTPLATSSPPPTTATPPPLSTGQAAGGAEVSQPTLTESELADTAPASDDTDQNKTALLTATPFALMVAPTKATRESANQSETVTTAGEDGASSTSTAIPNTATPTIQVQPPTVTLTPQPTATETIVSLAPSPSPTQKLQLLSTPIPEAPPTSRFGLMLVSISLLVLLLVIGLGVVLWFIIRK